MMLQDDDKCRPELSIKEGLYEILEAYRHQQDQSRLMKVLEGMKSRPRDEQEARDMYNQIQPVRYEFYQGVMPWCLGIALEFEQSSFFSMALILTYIAYVIDDQGEQSSSLEVAADEQNPSLESRLIGSGSDDSAGGECFNGDQEMSFDNLFEECRKPLTEATSSCEVNEIELEQKSVVQLRQLIQKLPTETLSLLLFLVIPMNQPFIEITQDVSELISDRKCIQQIRIASLLQRLQCYDEISTIYSNVKWNLQYQNERGEGPPLHADIEVLIHRSRLEREPERVEELQDKLIWLLETPYTMGVYQKASVCNEIATIYLRKGCLIDACHYLRLSLETDSTETMVRYSLALQLLHLGDYQASLRAIKPIFNYEIRQPLDKAIDLNLQGDILRELGQYDKARVCFLDSMRMFIWSYTFAEQNQQYLLGKSELLSCSLGVERGGFQPENRKKENSPSKITKVTMLCDSNNSFSKNYYDYAVNEFNRLEESVRYMREAGNLNQKEYCLSLSVIESYLDRYVSINGARYVEPFVYLAQVNIRKKNFSKATKYVSAVVERLKLKKCSNIKLILSFLGEVEQKEKFFAISRQDIRQIRAKNIEFIRTIIQNRNKDGERYLKKGEYLTALTAFNSISQYRQFMEQGEVSAHHSRILKCHFECGSLQSGFSSGFIYLLHSVEQSELLVDELSLPLLREKCRDIREEEDVSELLQRIKLDSENNQYLNKLTAFMLKEVPFFQKEENATFLDSKLNEKALLKGQQYFYRNDYEKAQIFLRKGMRCLKAEPSECANEYKKLLSDLIYDKQHGLLAEKDLVHIDKSNQVSMEKFEVHLRIGASYESQHNVVEANKSYELAFSLSENSQTYQKYIDSLLSLKEYPQVALIIEKFINFEHSELLLEENPIKIKQMDVGILALWKQLFQVGEELELSTVKKGEMTEKYLVYLDKTLKVNSLVKFKEVFKYLEQEAGSQQHLTDLFVKLIAIHPESQFYQRWKSFCLRNEHMRNHVEDEKYQSLCTHCWSILMSASSVAMMSELFLCLDSKEEEQFFRSFIDWLVKFKRRAGTNVSKSVLIQKFPKFNSFLKQAKPQTEERGQSLLPLKELSQILFTKGGTYQKIDEKQTFQICLETIKNKIKPFSQQTKARIHQNLKELLQNQSQVKSDVFEDLFSDYLPLR